MPDIRFRIIFRWRRAQFTTGNTQPVGVVGGGREKSIGARYADVNREVGKGSGWVQLHSILPACEETLIGDDGEVDGGNQGDERGQQPDEATHQEAPTFADRQAAEDVLAKVGIAGLGLYRHPAHFDKRPTPLNGHPRHEEGRRRENGIESRNEHGDKYSIRL